MHMLIQNMWQEKIFAFRIITLGNPPTPRAISRFNEPVDITGARRDLKNRCNDNIDSLPKSLASLERARCNAASFFVALISSRSSSHSNFETSAEKMNIIRIYKLEQTDHIHLRISRRKWF